MTHIRFILVLILLGLFTTSPSYSSASANIIPTQRVPQETVEPQATVVRGFSDDFASDVINPNWRWVNENPSKWSLTEVPGSLRIIGETGEMAVGCNNAQNVLLQSPSSTNFELITKLSIDPKTNFQQGGLVVFSTVNGQIDMDNYVKLNVLYNSEMYGQSSELLPEESGQYRGSWPYIAAPQSQPAYLKIVKVGTDYTGYYSSNGVDWSRVGSVRVTTISQPLVGLYASASIASRSDCVTPLPDIVVDFDYLSKFGSVSPNGDQAE
jgi:beta-xylosidase